MHVNFVAGVASTNTQCSNSSGVSAQFSADPNLSTMLSPTATGQGVSSANATSSSTSPSATSSKSAAYPAFKVALVSDCLPAVGLLLIFIVL